MKKALPEEYKIRQEVKELPEYPDIICNTAIK